jgi:hypothetical protein
MPVDWQRLEHEVQRVHLRYHVEVVEALGLCPWAKDARVGGRVRVAVSFMTEPDVAATWSLIGSLMAEQPTQIGIVVFPALPQARLVFAHFVAAVRGREAEIAPRAADRIALADFHPDAKPDDSAAERLVPFLRRAPDPMIQIVRQSALESVRLSEDHGTSFVDPSQYNLATLMELPSAPPSLAERVARNNARIVQRMGIARVEALLTDILRDRNASYAALGLHQPVW